MDGKVVVYVTSNKQFVFRSNTADSNFEKNYHYSPIEVNCRMNCVNLLWGQNYYIALLCVSSSSTIENKWIQSDAGNTTIIMLSHVGTRKTVLSVCHATPRGPLPSQVTYALRCMGSKIITTKTVSKEDYAWKQQSVKLDGLIPVCVCASSVQGGA